MEDRGLSLKERFASPISESQDTSNVAILVKTVLVAPPVSSVTRLLKCD